MAAPSPPFATTEQVAGFLQTILLGATDFADDGSTLPTKTAVTTIISVISSQIEMRFQNAGYVLPLAVIPDETWPSHQTTYLQLITGMGAAAMAGGHVLKPQPAVAPGRQGGTGSVLQDLFNAELRSIFNVNTGKVGTRFRANYYASTPAEEMLVIPRGPTTDFMEGKFDPERYLDLFEVADKILAIRKSMQDLSVSWDYLYGLFDFNRGFGTSIYEL